MKQPPWSGYVPAETLALYEQAGFGHHTPIGRRPALLVIDVQYSTTGEHPMPLPQALDYHPMNCGASAWDAVACIEKMIAAFRELSLPVLYPHVAPRKARDPNRRMPMASSFDPRHWQIVERVAPKEGDIVIPKTGPSAFTGTPLVNHLIKMGVDTVVLVGNTTSGCIRATATDAYAFNFKVLVPSDCSYDRSPVSHAVSLFDIHNKYAEVVDSEHAVDMVRASQAPV